MLILHHLLSVAENADMPAKDVLRYGLYYAIVYVGVLGLIFVGATIIAAFYEFHPSDLSIGALIAAALFTYLRFLKDKVRLPTSHEYWSLVAIGSIVVLVVDFTLGALVVHSTQQAGIDGLAVLILVGIPLLKGVLGNLIFFRGSGFATRTLEQIEAKQSRLGPPAAAPSNKMTFGDIGPLLGRYFAVYIPLFAVTRYVSITGDILGEVWLSPAITLVAAVCALAYAVRRLGRRPTRSEYGLLVIATVICTTAFEFIGAMAIYYYRFADMPNIKSVLSYMLGFVITSAVIHAVAYSPPVAWLVRPRTRSA
jgi:hypothetical protein